MDNHIGMYNTQYMIVVSQAKGPTNTMLSLGAIGV